MNARPADPLPGSPGHQYLGTQSPRHLDLEPTDMKTLPFSSRQRMTRCASLALATALFALATLSACPSLAMDLVTFAGVAGPLVGALATIATITPGVKAIVGVVGFIVAFIALTALRSFGPVLYYVGLAVFGSVGLVVAGAIMGAVI